MNKLLGGTILALSVVFAGPAGADEIDEARAAEVRRAEAVLEAAAKYGRACPRFFGEGTPLNIGRYLGQGRRATGERLAYPTTAGSIGWRMRSAKGDLPNRRSNILKPVSIGRRLDVAAVDDLQFCRVGTPTLGRYFTEKRAGSVTVVRPRKTAQKVVSQRPYQYKPVTYRPYGLPD